MRNKFLHRWLRKRNPSQEQIAEAGYEHFHGVESRKVTLDYMDWPPPAALAKYGPFPSITDTALLGELVSLLYTDSQLDKQEIIFRNPKPLLSCDYASEGKETLFISGGSYSEHATNLILGELHAIEYQTVKSFDDMTPQIYQHWMGEPWPILACNRKGDQLYIIRSESEFFINRENPVSAGIEG